MTAPSIVPLKDRLFAHLAVADGCVSLSKARRALEHLVTHMLAGKAAPSARRLLVDAGEMSPQTAHAVRRVRDGLLLECWGCHTLFWLQPFDPLYPHRCKRCGHDLAWPTRPPSPRAVADGADEPRLTASREPGAAAAGGTGEGEGTRRRGRDTGALFRPPSVSQVVEEYAASALRNRSAHAAQLELELIGRRMGRFVVRQLVGRGGMGSVYQAQEPHTQEVAAIKVMVPMAASAVDYVWRFKREAEMSSQLRHPNLVEVWEFGEAGPWLYLTMPYVHGKTLQQILHTHGRPLPIEPTVRQIVQALDGVHAAHEAGILHRDLKPDNLLVTPEGRVRVLDFGLARTQLEDRITQIGQTVGTPRFMSPEQWRDQEIGPPADVHAIGITLYYLLTGHFPYPEADTPLGAYHSMMDNAAVPLRQYRPDIDVAMEEAVHRMISKDARRRPATAREAAAILREWLPADAAEPAQAASGPAAPNAVGSERARRSERRIPPATGSPVGAPSGTAKPRSYQAPTAPRANGLTSQRPLRPLVERAWQGLTSTLGAWSPSRIRRRAEPLPAIERRQAVRRGLQPYWWVLAVVVIAFAVLALLAAGGSGSHPDSTRFGRDVRQTTAGSTSPLAPQRSVLSVRTACASGVEVRMRARGRRHR